MVLWNKSLQSDWSESSDKDELMSSSVLKWENKHFEIRFVAPTVWWMRTLSLYILWCCQLWSALFPVDMNTTTTVGFTSTQTHHHNKLLSRLIGWLFSSQSFTEESRKYWIFTLILCLVQYCWNQHELTPTLYWPQSLQSTVWTLLQITQQLHVWILQVVVTQVQLSQMGGVGLQSWGQRSTADLWQTAAHQSE